MTAVSGADAILGEDVLTSNNIFQYETLPARGWIRLLELQTGSGAFVCKLRHERLEDCASGFEALSYVWGSHVAEELSNIRVNDRAFSIGTNLASALLHLRHETEPKVLWVDAICINQNSEEERSQQVQQMGAIYASAKKVLVWVGPDERGEAYSCFALIKDTTVSLMEMFTRYGSIINIPPIPPGFICTDPLQWDMVRRLMNARWFIRVWVLQEVGLRASSDDLVRQVVIELEPSG